MELTYARRHGGRIATAAAVGALVIGGLLAGPASAASRAAGAVAPSAAAAAGAAPRMRAACPAVPAGYERCFALYQPQVAVNRAIAAGLTGIAAHPHGWGARGLEAAYRLPVRRDSHQTVAVSIAYNTPKLGRYLSFYRKYFGLPPCTAASGCFRQVNQWGKSSPLPVSGVGSGWDLEATLDVSMISVACPSCKILVVEAASPATSALARTDDTAARMGAQVISNSYGQRENGFAMPYARGYRHPGHTIVASAGDLGYTAANFPADLASVTAVGGTELTRAHNIRGFAESVWNSQAEFAAGSSGCSAYVRKPAWQHDRHCSGRTVADVAAVADNVAIYNRYYGGWVTVAGTSISAPLIAGIYGLAGNAAHLRLGSLYAHAGSLFHVSRGNNALFVSSKQACGNDYLCVAGKGYNAPTGLGTPDGIGAF
jgi:subtilase family serine protease